MCGFNQRGKTCVFNGAFNDVSIERIEGNVSPLEAKNIGAVAMIQISGERHNRLRRRSVYLQKMPIGLDIVRQFRNTRSHHKRQRSEQKT